MTKRAAKWSILVTLLISVLGQPACRQPRTVGQPQKENAMKNDDNNERRAGEPEDPRSLSDAEWRQRLSQDQYAVLRRGATEAPGSGEYNKFYEQGRYLCAGCGQELFRSEAKFDSGCGWPSFDRPADAEKVDEQSDTSHGMARTEVRCARCGGHLGHVFDDGPRQTTGQRYCINSAALEFKPAGSEEGKTEPGQGGRGDDEQQAATATFGAGCFWGVEESFRTLPGVVETAVGYCGGEVENPTYEQVCTDKTGHAEVVQVRYDAARISYEQLLEVFWKSHDPTQRNRQGPDVGRQYRSVIFYQDDQQRKAAETSRAALEASGKYKSPIATEIVPAKPFYRAEDYHQQYLQKRGRGSCHR